MVRRKAPPRRRRNNGVKLLGVAEAFVQANIVTQELMDVNPVQFVLGDAGPKYTVQGGGISLLELARRPELIGEIGKRAMNPERILNIAVMSALTNVGFKFAKKALRRPINLMNRSVFKPLALGVSL